MALNTSMASVFMLNVIYAECRTMLLVVILSVVMLNDIILNGMGL